jgi:short-subunit dehydrogenase
MSEADFPYQSALITGASSGVGRALAVALDKLGVQRIVLVARRQDALESLANQLRCEAVVCVADLSTDAGMALAKAELTGVDLLVNNAGFGSFGPFASLEPTREASMLRLNCEAPITLAGECLPGMVANGRGCVVNIASGMSFQPVPYMSTYAATKAFLLHWAEGVSAELSATGVRCVTICPGTIATGFADASAIPLDALPGVALVTCTLDSVIEATLRAIQDNTVVAVPGLGNRLSTFSSRFVPRAFIRWLMAAIMERGHRRISG